mmetsp:Transcript_13950/g.18298  ORF Transcript_13950/g.18298 Transcript_13950/m.18298 type:complete len:164 (-) Transcript_13950:795-1286(-)
MAQTIDEVSKNSIWREHVKKEDKIARPKSDFRINPNNLSPISPNPQNIDPRKISAEEVQIKDDDESAKRYETIRKFFEDKEAEDQKKDEESKLNKSLYYQTANSLAMTNTMKATQFRGTGGGDTNRARQKWYAGRNKCEITNYAEAYVRMAQTSPYSNKTHGT